MESHPASRDSLSPTCTLTFFDCFSPKEQRVTEKASPRLGVEREMKVLYQQPHLVPPMKLTVWDNMPRTPTPPPPSQLSQWVSQGRNLASRASHRASAYVRVKPAPKPFISTPQPVFADDDFVFRRRRDYQLELSIYMPNNRLSDLPEFDKLSFTEIGEIKFPPRALLRTKSEEGLQTLATVDPTSRKPASMFERRRMSHMRHDTASTIISTSRPPSEHDALHSHPVSWASLPGLPPQVHMTHKHEHSITILSPMQEEFTPPATSVMLDGMVLDFPTIDAKTEAAHNFTGTDSEAPAPSPKIPPAPTAPKTDDVHPAASYFHTDYHTQKRISQWLATRSHSSSFSTVRSSSTCSSFAEHRRKRSQFYQLSANQVAPPQPLMLYKPPSHQRTMTASTVASTVDTDIMSFENVNQSETSMTTAPELQSRSGTVKSGVGPLSASSHMTVPGMALKPIISGVPDLPPCYGEVVEALGKAERNFVIVDEIGVPLGSPGVGLAF